MRGLRLAAPHVTVDLLVAGVNWATDEGLASPGLARGAQIGFGALTPVSADNASGCSSPRHPVPGQSYRR